MPSPHPAVTPESIAIALKYEKSVSKGIKKMDGIIRGQKIMIALYRKRAAEEPTYTFEKVK